MPRRLAAWLAVSLALGACPAVMAQAVPAAAAAPAASGPLSPNLPLRRDSELAGGGSAYAAWIVALAVALGGVWLLRRSGGGVLGAPAWRLRPQAQRAPKLVGYLSLGPQASLRVVEWNGKELLIACSSQSVTVLDSRELSRPAEEEAGKP